MKIALLIPTTTKYRDMWNTSKDTYLYRICIPTFVKQLSMEDFQHTYCFYVGYDHDDRIFSNAIEHEIFYALTKTFSNISFQFIPFHAIPKGYITKMWNILYQKAYDDNCDYFYQCGDDISFRTKNWVSDSIKTLQKSNNIGLTGPLNNNKYILTQVFVSKLHMDIFGYLFPEEIINWCCDDWINSVYLPKYRFVLKQHFARNENDDCRYDINCDRSFIKHGENYTEKLNQLKEFTQTIVNRDKLVLKKYLLLH